MFCEGPRTLALAATCQRHLAPGAPNYEIDRETIKFLRKHAPAALIDRFPFVLEITIVPRAEAREKYFVGAFR